jgi:putative membrane protein insertion efficiency factor
MSPAARVLRLPVRLYQVAFAWRPSPCRYWPTCSQYAVEALETHGAVKGTWLALRRLGRCHPWAEGGIDPVPARGDAAALRSRGAAAGVRGAGG